ncbi:hypothetical protein AB0B86_02710 [Micromonospora sp. NPDC049047]|uniref:hypothetical protein n=1 Tax=Micromonospora sp. NPDC049047 TaxID=3155645 RepID=UPI00340BEB0C
MAYTLQAHGRAVVVGETTRGGAHPTARHPVTAHILVTVPTALHPAWPRETHRPPPTAQS